MDMSMKPQIVTARIAMNHRIQLTLSSCTASSSALTPGTFTREGSEKSEASVTSAPPMSIVSTTVTMTPAYRSR